MDDRYHAVRCSSLISRTQAAAALGEIGFQGHLPIRAQVQGLVVLAIIVVADDLGALHPFLPDGGIHRWSSAARPPSHLDRSPDQPPP